jgi:hypothetical protein
MPCYSTPHELSNVDSHLEVPPHEESASHDRGIGIRLGIER